MSQLDHVASVSRRLVSNAFGLDARSLAAFRIGLGLILLGDLAVRARDLTAHYTDAGVLPRASLVGWQAPGAWSLHLFGGSTQSQAVMLIIAAAAAVCLLIGYRARLAALASWVLLASLIGRNPVVINFGDRLLCALLLWAVFLPTDLRFAVRRGSPVGHMNPDGRVATLATAALVVQIAVVYLTTGLVKLNENWASGDALLTVLSDGSYARPLADWLLRFPGLVRGVSPIVPWLEVAAGVLVFCPWRTNVVRTVLVAVMIAFHIGIEATMYVGWFSWVSVVAWLSLIPPAVWDRLGTWLGRARTEASAAGEPAVRGRWRWLVNAIILALLAFSLANTLDAWRVRGGALPLLPMEADTAASALRFVKTWAMFRDPDGASGWYILVGERPNGTKIDLLTGEPFDPNTVTKPERFAALLPNHRWRKYYQAAAHKENAGIRRHMAGPVCAEWNTRRPDDPIANLEINYIEESPAGRRRVVFYRGVCPHETDITFKPDALRLDEDTSVP